MYCILFYYSPCAKGKEGRELYVAQKECMKKIKESSIRPAVNNFEAIFLSSSLPSEKYVMFPTTLEGMGSERSALWISVSRSAQNMRQDRL